MPEPSSNPQYLGDGVYASFDGFQIWLANGHHNNHVIALEPEVLLALIQYIKNQGFSLDFPSVSQPAI